MNHTAKYRGHLRAAIGDGPTLSFVTEHPEGLPTALYELNVDTDGLTAVPLPTGARSLARHGPQTLVGGTDGRVYRVANKKVTPVTESLGSPVAAVAAVPGQRLLALAGDRLIVASLATGELAQSITLPGRGTAMALDRTLQVLAVGTDRGEVGVFRLVGDEWEPESSAKLHEGAVTGLLFEREELRVFSTGADGKLLTTHAQGDLEPEDKSRGNAHEAAITAIVESNHADRIVTGGRDKVVKNWPRAGAVKPVTWGERVGVVVALTLVTQSDSPYLAVLAEDNSITLMPLTSEGRLDTDALDDHRNQVYEELEVWRGALDWARDSFQTTWNPKPREDALKQLAEWDDAASIDLIAEQIAAESESKVRQLGTELLGQSAHPRAVTHLEPLVRHADRAVRVAAFAGLRRRLGPDDPRPADLALASGYPEVGELALEVLEAQADRDDQALAKVVAALDAKTWEVRRRAVQALESVFRDDPARPVLTALGAASADVRALALGRAYQRGLTQDGAVRAAVRRRLEDDDATVRQVAFFISVLARPALAEALRARDAELHRQLNEFQGSTGAAPKPKTLKLDALDYDVLLQATASRPLDNCLRGANGLARLGDPRAFSLLLQLSREPTDQARVDACRSLEALGDPRAMSRLRSLLADPEPAVRDAAYSAVRRLSPAPLAAAEAALLAPFEDVRRRGLETVLAEARPDADALPALLLRALNDPAPAVRREAFKAVLNRQTFGPGEPTLRFLNRSAHADVRREVLGELKAKSQEPFATPFVYEFFEDADDALRREAFEFAVKKNSDLEPLLAALRSRFPDARQLALSALHRKHSRAAQAVILTAVNDPDPAVRLQAVRALVSDDARAPLAESLAAANPDVRVEAARALARLGDARSLSVLADLAFAPKPSEAFRVDGWRQLATSALEGLGLLGDAAAFERLVTLLESEEPALRQAAATALVDCTPPGGEPRLRRSLTHPDPAVRRSVALALAARGDVTVHPLLRSEQASSAERLSAALAAEPQNPEAVAEFLDAAEPGERQAALVAHFLLERATPDGVPDLMLQALSAKHPRVRLAAAEGLEAFNDPQSFADAVVKTANDRGDETTWKLTPKLLEPLAAVLRFAPPLTRFRAGRLLALFEPKESARLVETWGVFAERYAGEVTQAIARLKPVESRLTVGQLRELVLGAYIGLVREQGTGTAVARVRQTALSRVFALAERSPEYARAARPVLTQSLADPHQPVRFQAFDHLQSLGLSPAELGAEALESGETDLGVRGLELLTDGTTAADGTRILEQMILTRTDDLATESAKLLARTQGYAAVAARALDSVYPPLRQQAVRWLGQEYPNSPPAQAALRSALTSRYRQVRELAATTLARLRDPAALPGLTTLLREARTATEQGQLVAAFVELGDPAGAGALLERVEVDPTGTADTRTLLDAAGQFRAGSIAGRLLALAEREPSHLPLVVTQLERISGFDQAAPDPEDDPAFAKAEREQHPRRPAVLAGMIEFLTRAAKLGQHLHLVNAAGAARGTEVDLPLAALVNHADAAVRQQAVVAVGWRAKFRGGPTEPLLKALKHKDAVTQFVAAEGLARVGRAEGLTVLLSGLEYIDDYGLRNRAVLALGELADARVVEPLLKLATETGHALQEAAAEAIGHLRNTPKGEEVGRTLLRLARSPLYGVARQAMVGLRHHGSPEAWQFLRSQAVRGDHATRALSCEQLGYDADPATRAVLLTALRADRAPVAVEAALESSLRVFGPASVEPFYALLTHPQFATTPLTGQRLVATEVAAKSGDPLRLMQLLPSCTEAVQYQIERSLVARAGELVGPATEALSQSHGASVRLAGRILASARSLAPATEARLAEALQAWWRAWQTERANLDRAVADPQKLDRVRSTVTALVWAGSRSAAATPVLKEIVTTRAGDGHAHPLRLAALRSLGARPSPSPELTELLVALTRDLNPEVRTLAAGALSRRQPGAVTPILAENFADAPTFARLAGAGAGAVEAARGAVSQPSRQSVALPVLVAARDIGPLLALARDDKAELPTRYGAVEALGAMGDPAAEAALGEFAKQLADATGEGAKLRQATWRAVRRSGRLRTPRPRPTPSGATPS